MISQYNQQPSSNLPTLNTLITGHDAANDKSIIASQRPATWTTYENKKVAFHIAYATSRMPVWLTDEEDMIMHENVMTSNKLGLVNPGGTVCRVVDFAPGFDSGMHQTLSLDYGGALEGSIELVLDSRETQTMFVRHCCPAGNKPCLEDSERDKMGQNDVGAAV